MTKTCPTSPLEPITPIENVIRALETAKKDLLQQGIHSPEHTFVGIQTDQLQLIDVVLARREGRQKSLLKGSFGEQALEERAGYDQFVNSLQPLLTEIVQGTAYAEDVARLITETGEPDRARRMLVGNVSGSLAAKELHVQLKSDESLKIPKRSFPAKNTYQLKLRASSVIFTQKKGTATIEQASDEWNSFGSKRQTARIHLEFRDPKHVRIFSLCLAYGIEFKANITPSIKLAANDLVFAGTLVDFLELPKLGEAIQKSERDHASDLFGPLL